MSVPYAFEGFFKQNPEGMVRVRHAAHQLVTEQFNQKKETKGQAEEEDSRSHRPKVPSRR